MDAVTDWLVDIVAWLWAAVVALILGAWRTVIARVVKVETRVEAVATASAERHDKIYERIESLRLENKTDHAALRTEVTQRFDRLEEWLHDRYPMP